jgi:two-component system phosphate regulon sensor histidine kinase PhoR
VKRTFTIITILITLSLVGIIAIQVSWIKNMVSLRREQIEHSVDESAITAAAELAQHKGSYASGLNRKSFLSNDFELNLFKSPTVGKNMAVDEIQKKIQTILNRYNLKNVRFEFGIASFDTRGDIVFEKMSARFMDEYADTANNYVKNSGIEALSGTASENLSIDETLFLLVPDINKLVYKSLRWRIIISLLFTAIILAAFYLTVRTMLRQKKLGEIKNDFINNMTHEFKTPLATISLAVDAMRNDKVINDKDKLGYFSGIIKEENQRMNRQVETILRASQLEKQEVELNLKPVHVQELIKDVVENFDLQLQEKNGKVDMDNAMKYGKENVPPYIKLSTHSNGKIFSMRIEDNGIGMARDTVKRIFEKFYRAHTGNVHNVKGFGLGLSYVKTMVEAHGGDIKAESTLGKGSTFTLEFPLKKN